MNLFNSLGSNYSLNFVFRSLFNFNSNQDREKLEKLLETKYQGKIVLLYKGREAIELALKILDLPEGCFVAINGFTCLAVYQAIKNANLKAEYLDIERGDLNFSASTLKQALEKNPNIKVVIVQNTLGYPCKIDEISKLCKEEKITLIEDLAHCVGTKYESGLEAGTVADIVAFSFSQDKMIDGISGGALVVKNITAKITNDFNNLNSFIQIKDRLYPFFTHLIRSTYDLGVGKILHILLKTFDLLTEPMNRAKPVEGINSNRLHKLPSFYCNLIKSSFDNLETNLSHRRSIARIYSQIINPKIMSKTLNSQIERSANLRFPIFVNNRESLISYMRKFGVYISDIWYDAPIAPKKYLPLTDYKSECPNAELAAKAVVNLPTHINVSKEEAEKISNIINQWLKSQ